MSVDDLVDELYNMLDKAWSLPMSHGKAVLDGDQMHQILDEIRASLPEEIHQARAIVADRTQILNDAKRESDTMIRVAQDEIVRKAQQKANGILDQAEGKTREMRRATNEYVDDLMKRTDDNLTALLAEARKVRQNIKASQKSSQKSSQN